MLNFYLLGQTSGALTNIETIDGKLFPIQEILFEMLCEKKVWVFAFMGCCRVLAEKESGKGVFPNAVG